MIKLLPIEILDWVNSKDFNLDNFSDDSSVGCFLEADLDYPDDYRNDYALAGEKVEIRKEILPGYQST